MNDYFNECKKSVAKVRALLEKNREWVKRYATYAQTISANLGKIKNKKKSFNEWAPLYLYTTISEATRKMTFSLRYLGQEVAILNSDSEKITISTTKYDKSNDRDFDCKTKLDNKDWTSQEAKVFRRHFSDLPMRTDKSKKGNEEHRIESLLLTEFSKNTRKGKIISNIQPVKVAGIARFQMPTPLSASGVKDVTYANWNGGGIDILSRIGTGTATKLCVMEVKDENVPIEPPSKAILQALAYSTFIRELLRSESGELWWKIFGFKGKLPYQLEIYVVCVMPSTNNNDKSFGGGKISIDGDSFLLNYMYFKELDNCILDIKSSLKQCRTN